MYIRMYAKAYMNPIFKENFYLNFYTCRTSRLGQSVDFSLTLKKKDMCYLYLYGWRMRILWIV